MTGKALPAYEVGIYGSLTVPAQSTVPTLTPSDADITDLNNQTVVAKIGRNKRSILTSLVCIALVMFGVSANHAMGGSGEGRFGLMGSAVSVNGTDVGELRNGHKNDHHHQHHAEKEEVEKVDDEKVDEKKDDKKNDDDAPSDDSKVDDAPISDDIPASDVAPASDNTPAASEHKHHKHRGKKEEDTSAPSSDDDADDAPADTSDDDIMDDDVVGVDDDDASEPAAAADNSAEPASDDEKKGSKHHHHNHHHHHHHKKDKDHDHDSDHDSSSSSSSSFMGGVMSCLEMPSKCQSYLVPAARDYSNPETKAALMCVEGGTGNKTSGCMIGATEKELKDPKSPRR